MAETQILLNGISYSKLFPKSLAISKIIETHISVVLIGTEYVLKFKKAVNLGFVNHLALKDRWRSAAKEILLNRRLAQKTYLGLYCITNPDEIFNLDRLITNPDPDQVADNVIEIAVVMQRVAEETMLNVLINQEDINLERKVVLLAQKLSEFHLQLIKLNLGVSQTSAFHSMLETIRDSLDNFRALEDTENKSLSKAGIQALSIVEKYTEGFLSANLQLFEQRALQGFVVDGHGDLRAEHVSLHEGEVVVLDCVEFNDNLRICDVLSDIGFLLMDLDLLGRGDLRRVLEENYFALFPQGQHAELLRFYLIYRAMVRAKVEMIKADRQEINQKEEDYLALACRYALKVEKKFVLAVGGLMGVGKTTFAQYLQKLSFAKLFQTDVIRKEKLIGMEEDKKLAFGQGRYSAEGRIKVYQTMFDCAQADLKRGNPVILDATFSKFETRQKARALAMEFDAEFLFVECQLPKEVTLTRLKLREQEMTSLSDGRVDLYQDQVNEFEKVREEEKGTVLSVNMQQPLEVIAEMVLSKLQNLY